MTKVGIIYGWSEGESHGRRFRKYLRLNGYSITKDYSEADVLVVHSGGYFVIPDNNRAKLILLVNYPNYTNKPIYKSLAGKIRHEISEPQSIPHQVKKYILAIVYMAIRPIHHIRIRLGYVRQVTPKSSANFIVIKNQKDTYMDQIKSIEMGQNSGWNVLSLPGHHDDLWLNPDAYVSIIKKYIKPASKR